MCIVASNAPNRVVSDSAASRNGPVGMAKSCSLLTWTSANDFLSVSKKVVPAGYEDVDMMTRD